MSLEDALQQSPCGAVYRIDDKGRLVIRYQDGFTIRRYEGEESVECPFNSEVLGYDDWRPML